MEEKIEMGCCVLLVIFVMIAAIIGLTSEHTVDRNKYQKPNTTPLYTPPKDYSPMYSTPQPAPPIQRSEPNYNYSSSTTPDDAESEGYDNGYEQGRYDGRHGYSRGCNYDDSSDYYDYYETRYQDGYEEGYDDGYSSGYSEYEDNNEEELD